MKAICCVTLFLTLMAVGCVTTQEKGGKGTMWKSHVEPPPPPVMPAQVEPENAHKQSQALWNEMDHQEESDLLKENAAKAAPPKK